MYKNNVIQIESLNQMPFDDVLSLYRQGYKLEEKNDWKGNNWNLNRIGNVENRIVGLGTCKGSSCPCTVTVGTTLTLAATATSGTPGYTYHWTIKKPDGNIDSSLTGSSNSYTFSQVGDYTISVNVTDSCAAGAKVSNTDKCVVSVVSGTTAKYKKCVGGTCAEVDCPTTGTCPSNECTTVGATCGVVNNYGCVGTVCTPGVGTLPPGCNNSCGGAVTGCNEINCPSATNYCIGGQCIKKTYVYAAGAGLVLLLVLSK